MILLIKNSNPFQYLYIPSVLHPSSFPFPVFGGTSRAAAINSRVSETLCHFWSYDLLLVPGSEIEVVLLEGVAQEADDLGEALLFHSEVWVVLDYSAGRDACRFLQTLSLHV